MGSGLLTVSNGPSSSATSSFEAVTASLALPYHCCMPAWLTRRRPLPSATSAQLLDILPAFIRAAKLPAHTCADVSVHLRNRNRVAILKTHHIELASRLLSVESIMLAGRIYAVAPYLAASTNSCRGVIHGIAPDATQDELLRDLDSYQADILLARRMGNTNSALITFAGMHVPFSVYYQRLEFRCRPHKPRAHHCTICLQYEHRTWACPGNQPLQCTPLVPRPLASLMNHIPAHHGVFIVKAITLPLQKYAQFGCNGMKPAPTRPRSSASYTDSSGRV
ncbi:hypothetical protein HPB49_008255 [Dermacentor silvarum]|uniref:Uncharacterized protein n=1 Tax=Dermacentor silvarum TaxID=543639 RepID=A0ACB8DX62_DERSI|nr:hypothetical protein HPB49_008255 [Dermacentor silvarum]